MRKPDSSGVVIVPQEHVDEVLAKAEELWQKEEDMIKAICGGADILEVDAKFAYNRMLQNGEGEVNPHALPCATTYESG